MIAKDLGTARQRLSVKYYLIKHYLMLLSFNSSKDIPVYNMTLDETKRITYGEFFNIANAMKWEIPFSVSLWYPNATITLNRYWYFLNIILFQWIPAYFVDFLLMIFGQKRL
jgi:hypothetical protein